MDKSTRFYEWIVIAEHSRDTEKLTLEKLTRPKSVGGILTPPNLDTMTLGQMVQLSDLKSGRQMFYAVCEVLLGMGSAQVNTAFAVDVVRFVGWVLGRVQGINKLFDSIKGEPTAQEMRAGVSKLQFGVFGIVDWYAQRMGISDHEEVMGVPWVRIYKCLEIDNKRNEFEKRLAKVYSDEHRK